MHGIFFICNLLVVISEKNISYIESFKRTIEKLVRGKEFRRRLSLVINDEGDAESSIHGAAPPLVRRLDEWGCMKFFPVITV